MSAEAQTPSVHFGPVGSTSVAWARWSIRNNRWIVPGVSGPHQLKIDSGFMGFGPIHIRVDGKLITSFPKPTRKQPATTSAPLEMDGFEVHVYTQTMKGANVNTDVFVNGRSLLDGSPIAVLPQRVAAAPFDPVVVRANRAFSAGRIAIGVSFGELLSVTYHPKGPSVLLAAAVLIAGNLLVLKAGGRGLRWAEGFGASQPISARQTLVVVAAVVGFAAVLTTAVLVRSLG